MNTWSICKDTKLKYIKHFYIYDFHNSKGYVLIPYFITIKRDKPKFCKENLYIFFYSANPQTEMSIGKS